jgi:3-isopropylmalate/(R)-2-methylmalate dehydratase small subunit
MQAFTSLDCFAATTAVDNIDTDRIIPARFLTTTSREGMGEALFADWKMGREAADGAQLLVAGHNFGCGSSREHAVWALQDAGIRVVVSTGFADIFYNNALRNGLVPVVLDNAAHRQLMDAVASEPDAKVNADLPAQELRFGELRFDFDFDPFAKHCITRGLDELGYLLEQLPAIARFEAQHASHLDTQGEPS